MYTEPFYTSAREVPNPLRTIKAKAKIKPVTSRLQKSKNFWKVDRCLDDYIDRTKLIKCGPKRLLKKLLLLRARENGNEVKVTVSGLTKLMSVNIKTVRSWLKSLEQAEFIYYQGEVREPHCNYPKKKYMFPLTFPGFDSATVFIRKGAKAKYKKRMADPVRAQVKARKMARLTAQMTCPENAALRDCSPLINQSGTQNSHGDTTVSPIEILARETHSAAPTAFAVPPPSEETPILDLVPELKALLVTVLAQNNCKGKIQWVSNFIESFFKLEGSRLEGYRDRMELAEDLLQILPLYFVARERTRDTIGSLFKFLDGYLRHFIGRDWSRTDAFHTWLMGPGYVQMDETWEFFKRYPFCNPEDYRQRTGVNRGWGF